ncbi:phospholipid-transporting ATPase [Thraustotheca clavata]|uniref:Phospholipid-transporting ATPase n=1 Tax=Thraustotheca clavata TaxID=74557 RepID=A0A1W0A0T7_9STRA|nr:phospholipid-transporting ATPase [Thraustotheca clavata]
MGGATVGAEYRRVHVRNPSANAALAYPSNFVRTTKYTLLTFLPLFLFESFQKVANGYFLVVSALQCISAISNTNGIPATLPTLLLILAVDATFAIIEDLKRRQADTIANGRQTHKLQNNQSLKPFIPTTWSDLQVGDIVKIHNHEPVPADLLILSVPAKFTRDEAGACYIETKSLDGETSLKLRQALSTTARFTAATELFFLRGHATVEQPNNSIHSFKGFLELEGDRKNEKAAITISNMLLRGSTLRSTPYIYGLVINTGMDTKIILGNRRTPSKHSHLEHQINLYIGILVVILIVFCCAAATGNLIWTNSTMMPYIYLNQKSSESTQWLLSFFYYFLLMYQFVPISLYVSMGTAKYLQAKFIEWDLSMYHSSSNTPATVRSMSLNEELGQITHVVTDKTGTLTSNIMQFRRCCIRGISYGHSCMHLRRSIKKHPSTKIDFTAADEDKFVNFETTELLSQLDRGDGYYISLFFTILAVCHSVIRECDENDPERIIYSAASSDEQALVCGAKVMDFVFLSRTTKELTIAIRGTIHHFDILATLEFDSNRRRMSIVVRDAQINTIFLFTKGADSGMEKIIKVPTGDFMCKMNEATSRYVRDYATEGFRTLLVGYKPIDEAWFQRWLVRYEASLQSIRDVELRQRGCDNRIDACMREIEIDLELLGATAVEDKLQDYVGETISTLRAAGMKLWMLTGDKEETAINIGLATNLLLDSMHNITLNEKLQPTIVELTAELRTYYFQFSKSSKPKANTSVSSTIRSRIAANSISTLTTRSKSQATLSPSRISLGTSLPHRNEREYSLLVSGGALDVLLQDNLCRELFMKVAEKCGAVIAYRVSPSQKATLVRLLMNNSTRSLRRVLAIGDGANDIPMLQEAHIGVGISGQEGMQAANSSDFAIAQFSYLRTLLLVHGRNNYERIAKLILYILYKNILLISSQYWFTWFTGVSGQKIYLEIGVQLYNVLFTSLPIVLLAVLDADLPNDFIAKLPILYKAGPRQSYLNHKCFISVVLSAIAESLFITFTSVKGLSCNDSNGSSPGLWLIGAVVLTLVVALANLKLIWWQHSIHQFSYAAYFGSIFLWVIIAVVCSDSFLLSGFAWFELYPLTFHQPSVLLVLLLVITTVIILSTFSIKAYMVMVHPTASDIVKEIHSCQTCSVDIGPMIQNLLEPAKAPSNPLSKVLDTSHRSIQPATTH